MTPYTLALFAHIVGAISVFAGIGTWLFIGMALRRTQQVAQVRALARLTVASGNVAVGGVLLLAVAGLYMAWTTWGWQTAWIDVATAGFLLLAPFGAFVIDRRIRALGKAADAEADGPLPASLAAQVRDPTILVGLHTYLGVLLGIVFLMTTQPALGGAILALVIATAFGLISASPYLRRATPFAQAKREA
jgi:Predicted integral membrane protein (DUF2269)